MDKMHPHPLALNQYASFDNIIDLPGLLSLHDELCAAIAKTPWTIGVNARWREDGLKDASDYRKEFKANPNPLVNSLNEDQQYRYALLKYNAGYLGHTARIRTHIDYDLKHLAKGSSITASTPLYSKLFAWLDAQDFFSEYGRVVAFITPAGYVTPAHMDWTKHHGQVNEFLWLRTSSSKEFGLLDNSTPRNFSPIEGHTAWFNNAQHHGSNGTPAAEWGFSIRIDGVFTPKIRSFLNELGCPILRA